MKDLIVIFVVLGVVFGGNFFENIYLERTTKELIEIVNEMEKGIDTASEDEKIILEKKLWDKWEQCEKPWIAFLYHKEINNVEDILIECYTFYLEGDRTHFLLNVRKLNRNLEDLKNREVISLVNVL